jgi:hypothetical protein
MIQVCAISSAFLQDCMSLILSFLSGTLNIGYLGTKPPISAVGGVNHSRTLDYDKVDEEHKQLLQVLVCLTFLGSYDLHGIDYPRKTK